MEPDELGRLEIVVAAPHSALRSTDDQTARMVARGDVTAASTSSDIRAAGSTARGPVSPPIGTRCSKPRRGPAWRSRSTAILSRQDLDYTLAGGRSTRGCLFALDSDAHSTTELRYAETAVAHARLAGMPRERVINCWPLDRLLDWAARRSHVPRRRRSR